MTYKDFIKELKRVLQCYEFDGSTLKEDVNYLLSALTTHREPGGREQPNGVNLRKYKDLDIKEYLERKYIRDPLLLNVVRVSDIVADLRSEGYRYTDQYIAQRIKVYFPDNYCVFIRGSEGYKKLATKTKQRHVAAIIPNSVKDKQPNEVVKDYSFYKKQLHF